MKASDPNAGHLSFGKKKNGQSFGGFYLNKEFGNKSSQLIQSLQPFGLC